MALQDALGNPLAFITGPSPQDAAQQAALSPASIERRRKLADAMLEAGTQYSPIQSPWQGVARVTDAIMGGLASRRADEREAASRQASSASMASTLANIFGGQGYGAPIGGAATSPVADAGMGAGPARQVTTPQDAADAGGHTPVAQAVNDQIPATGRALLDTIAGTESPNYNTRYGGATFNDFSDHPRIGELIKNGPNAGKTSAAAGRYQFLPATWDAEAQKLGLKDFSPANQDAAAWDLAQTTYKQQTGQDLSEALQSGDPKALAMVGQSLRGQWTSLPGGIEAGTNGSRFAQAYAQNFGRYGRPQQQAAATAPVGQGADPSIFPGPIPAPLPDPRAAGQTASLDPSIGMPAPGPQAGDPPMPPVDPRQAGQPPIPPGFTMPPLSPADQAKVTALQQLPPPGPQPDPRTLTDAPLPPGSPQAGPMPPITPQLAGAIQQQVAPAVPPGALVGPPGIGGAGVPPMPPAPMPDAGGALTPPPPAPPVAAAAPAMPPLPPQGAPIMGGVAGNVGGPPPVSMRPGSVLPPDQMGVTPTAQQRLMAAIGGGQLAAPAAPALAPNRAAIAGAMSPAPAASPQGAGGPDPRALAAMAQIMNDPWADPTMKQMAVQSLMQRYAPHKLIPVDAGDRILMQDELTGQTRQVIPKALPPEKLAPGEYLADRTTGAPLGGGQPPASAHPLVTPQERAQWGIPANDDKPYFLDAAGKLQTPDRGTTVNMGAQTDWAKGVDKADLEHYSPYIEAGKDAAQKQQALQILSDAWKNGGDKITTGPFADRVLGMKQALENWGWLPPGTSTPSEIVSKIGTQLATADAKDLASRPTQFDFSTYLKNNPGLTLSAQGNQTLIAIKMQQAQRQADLAKAAFQFMHSPDAQSNPGKFDEMIDAYDKAHPIISPFTGKPIDPNATEFPGGAEQASPAAAVDPSRHGQVTLPAAAPAPAAPKSGDEVEGYIFQGGDPADQKSWKKK